MGFSEPRISGGSLRHQQHARPHHDRRTVGESPSRSMQGQRPRGAVASSVYIYIRAGTSHGPRRERKNEETSAADFCKRPLRGERYSWFYNIYIIHSLCIRADLRGLHYRRFPFSYQTQLSRSTSRLHYTRGLHRNGGSRSEG